MNRVALFSLLLSLTINVNSSVSAAETTSGASPTGTSDSLVRIIEKSNVVPGYKVSARLDKEEAIVSTYRNLESKKEGLDNDCKIDATLIAKELMLGNSLGIKRVRVHFHEPTLTGTFREVVVSLPEVKAFATGAVTQQEYMDSIAINRLPEKQTEPAAVTTQATSAPTTEGPKSGSPPVEKPAVKVQKPIFRTRDGINFEIPDGWTVDAGAPGSDILATLYSRTTKQDNIILKKVRARETPARLAAVKRKEFTYTGVSFERYESTRFGKGGYGGALISIIYPHESGTPYYDIHLYFGSPPFVYELYGWSSTANSRPVKQAYTDLMTSMTLPGTTPGTAGSAKKPAAKK